MRRDALETKTEGTPGPHMEIQEGCSDNRASLVAQMVKNPPAMHAGDLGLIPGSVRSLGEGNGYLLQYSCLKNRMDRGAWWATVHGVAKSRTGLSD